MSWAILYFDAENGLILSYAIPCYHILMKITML